MSKEFMCEQAFPGNTLASGTTSGSVSDKGQEWKNMGSFSECICTLRGDIYLSIINHGCPQPVYIQISLLCLVLPRLPLPMKFQISYFSSKAWRSWQDRARPEPEAFRHLSVTSLLPLWASLSAEWKVLMSLSLYKLTQKFCWQALPFPRFKSQGSWAVTI